MAVEPIEVVVLALIISSGETATVAAAAATSAVAAIFGFHPDSQQHTLCSVLGRLFNLGPGLQARKKSAGVCSSRSQTIVDDELGVLKRRVSAGLGSTSKRLVGQERDDSIRFLVCCLSMLQRASGQSAVPKKR